ncbi:hypothetical protein V8D89_006166 [Ganoderma adspersum]
MEQLTVLVGSSLVLYLIWLLVRNYFVRSPLDKLPGPPSGSIISGNIFQIFNHNSWNFVDGLVETYGPLSKCTTSSALDRLLIGPGLLRTYGAAHKKQRKMLNPVFSGAHMRNLTPLFYDVADRLRAALESRVQDGPEDLDVLAWMGRTALELIGRGGLGYPFDPLVSDSRDVFTESIKKFVPAADNVVWTQEFAPYLSYLGPAWFRRFLLELVPISGIQRLKTISDITNKRMEEIYFAKKAATESGDTDLLHGVGEGKDIMSVLLRENMKASEEDRLTDEEVLAQMGIFIVASMSFQFNIEQELAPYRALLFVNGWKFGKRAADYGPQTCFPVPPGILDYSGNKWSLPKHTTISALEDAVADQTGSPTCACGKAIEPAKNRHEVLDLLLCHLLPPPNASDGPDNTQDTISVKHLITFGPAAESGVET